MQIPQGNGSSLYISDDEHRFEMHEDMAHDIAMIGAIVDPNHTFVLGETFEINGARVSVVSFLSREDFLQKVESNREFLRLEVGVWLRPPHDSKFWNISID